jgi:hypothetical protein
MASEPMTFRVNGVDYPVPTDMTLGEMADMERFFGVNFQKPETSTMAMWAGLLYIAIRRVDDTVTVDDIRALPSDSFDQVGGDARPPDETHDSEQPASTVPTEKSSSSGSDELDPAPPGSGDPTSDSSTTSDLATLAT